MPHYNFKKLQLKFSSNRFFINKFIPGCQTTYSQIGEEILSLQYLVFTVIST